MATMTDDQIISCMKDASSELKQSCEETNDWEVVKEEDDIIVGRKATANSEIYLFKMQGFIDAPAKVVYDLLVDVTKRKFIDEKCVEYTAVKQITTDVQLVYQAQASLGMLIAPRDVALARLCIKETEDTYVVAARSVVTDVMPPKDGYVRAEVKISGWVVKSVGSNRCQVSAVLHVDPKGWIPGFVVNAAGSEGTIASFQNLRKLAIETSKK